MNNFASWFGVGIKGGGSIGLGGFETMEGYISNLGMINHSHSINISYLRLGPGLGAGIGMCAIYVFNCMNPQNLHKKTIRVGVSMFRWAENGAMSLKFWEIPKC